MKILKTQKHTREAVNFISLNNILIIGLKCGSLPLMDQRRDRP